MSLVGVRMGESGGVQEENESMGEDNKTENLSGIESGGVSLSSFIFVGRSAGSKCKHHCFPLWCVIYCDTGIFMYLLITILKII